MRPATLNCSTQRTPRFSSDCATRLYPKNSVSEQQRAAGRSVDNSVRFGYSPPRPQCPWGLIVGSSPECRSGHSRRFGGGPREG